MKIKLNTKQYDFLKENLEAEKPEIFKILESSKNNLEFNVDEDTADEIREWAADRLVLRGFDINYKLNDEGIILNDLIDLFYM